MLFLNKAATTVTDQWKSHKPAIATLAAAGLLVPALAAGSPALAATFSSAHHGAGRTATVQLDSSGRNHQASKAGHLGMTPTQSGNGKGGNGKTPTTGTTPAPTPTSTGTTPAPTPTTTGTTPAPTPTPTGTTPAPTPTTGTGYHICACFF
jgi:hypothetical protein